MESVVDPLPLPTESVVDPLPLLEEPEVEAEPAPTYFLVEPGERELSFLSRSRPRSTAPPREDGTRAMPPELGQRLALRALRDALALQLARRGFDKLRSSAMNLLTELTADFVRALGAELRQVAPADAASAAGATPLVVHVQHLVNMRSAAEWRQAQILFSRQSEPLGPSAQQLVQQQQPKLGGPPPPPGVAGLYSAVRGAWHYKQSHAGRTAHAQASQQDFPHLSSASTPPSELSGSLCLGKKQRLQADAWLHDAPRNNAIWLLPGLPNDGGGVGAGGGGSGGGRGGGGHKKRKVPGQ
ncbi:hypothetical protein AB1Y20_009648 [Prymnesium parvum]|uniref:Bromodomain associated domain-containing protein n=1 Tax=Prymnesium parvum TaxID=97485 RepID=A0AB34K220_PRYPA